MTHVSRLDLVRPPADDDPVQSIRRVDRRRGRGAGLQARRIGRRGLRMGRQQRRGQHQRDGMGTQQAGAVHVPPQWLVVSRRSAGNRITSRMLGLSVSSIISRSMPTPQPPVGGMPYSSARTKSWS